jgi:hypothetical protein
MACIGWVYEWGVGRERRGIGVSSWVLDWRADIITEGWKGIQSCLTWVLDLAVMIELKDETEGRPAEMGEKVEIKGEVVELYSEGESTES